MRCGDVGDGQPPDRVRRSRGGAGPADGRTQPERLEGVVERGAEGSLSASTLTVQSRPAPVTTLPRRTTCLRPGSVATPRRTLTWRDALRVLHLGGVPAAAVGDGDPGPEHHPSGEGVAGHDPVPERLELLGDRVGTALRQPARVAAPGPFLGAGLRGGGLEGPGARGEPEQPAAAQDAAAPQPRGRGVVAAGSVGSVAGRGARRRNARGSRRLRGPA